MDRKPRMALMGEFSAGKSTLANVLLGVCASRMQVTATQMPPVLYTYGPPGAAYLDGEGLRHEVPEEAVSTLRPDEVQMVERRLQVPFLENADLFDMPGTSDPNMAPDIWQDILPEVDLVVWCTPANQAWRQSEAALWEQVPPALWEKSLLLVTRIDKIRSDRDRARLLKRVELEAGEMFRKVLPIDLLQSLEGLQDPVLSVRSGAIEVGRFIDDALGLGTSPKTEDPDSPVSDPGEPKPTEAQSVKIRPRRIIRRQPDSTPAC